MNEEKFMTPLPLWEPPTAPSFTAGMQFNAPFISTGVMQRGDLGECVICTYPPHFVAKVRAFKTHADYREGRDGYNQKQLDMAMKRDTSRQKWISTRIKANGLALEAQRKGISVEQMQEQYNIIYDDEFDEPRLVAKVPGLNVYLELFGCLDDVEHIDWDGEYGAKKTLQRMSTWAQNIWDRHNRRPRASHSFDEQPLEAWREEYDETLRPFMPKKRGIGIWPHIDVSRRPELMYTKTPSFEKAQTESIRILKAESARLASMGIKPGKE